MSLITVAFGTLAGVDVFSSRDGSLLSGQRVLLRRGRRRSVVKPSILAEPRGDKKKQDPASRGSSRKAKLASL